jgi:tetratricopeptide (TPR) repeat protein
MLSAFLFVFATGCATIPDHIRQLPEQTQAIELHDTPFFPQERFQCGPAALATVLVSSGVEASVTDLVDKVYLPGREGSLQVELLAATRTSGRIPYLLDGTLASLYAELDLNSPVLVLQNLGVAALPRWHYAVVVGIDPSAKTVILRSGTDERRVTSIRTFLHTWRRSDYWAMVALQPGEIPAKVERVRYLAAIAAFEQAGQQAGMTSVWQASEARWPTDSLVLLGLANSHYVEGDYAAAEVVLQKLLELDEGNPIARNNLAMALIKQKNYGAAMQQVERALNTVTDANVKVELMRTRATAISGLESAAKE